MKQLLFFSVISTALYASACKKTDDTVDYQYHAHINAPTADDKHVGDTMHIHVDFESHSMETIHHVNIRIYNKADLTEVYNMPTEAHVHATSGSYAFHDDFILSNANGVTAHTDWVLEAKVWGHEDGLQEETATVEFHVHP